MNYRELWRILVPRGFPLVHHYDWDDFIIKVAGGLTLGETGEGKWKENKTEGFIQVDVACTRVQLLQILKFTQQHYKQEAIMCYKISDEVIIYDSKDTGLPKNTPYAIDEF